MDALTDGWWIVLAVITAFACLIDPLWMRVVRKLEERASADTSWSDEAWKP